MTLQLESEQKMAKCDWILDVLIDLISYAKANEMPNLARGLEAAAVEAVTEMATSQFGDTELE